MQNNKITVLHLCEHFGGKEASLHGVARAFQWWIPAFDSSQFNILLCSRKGYDKAAGEMIKKGVRPIYLGYGKKDPRNLFRLLRILKQQQVDILHAHGFGSCMWARLAGRMLNIPVIVHGRANYGRLPSFMIPVEKLLGPLTEYGLAVSESTRQFMIRKRYIPEENVRVLYSGIMLDKITLMDEEFIRETRRKNNAEGKVIIGIVGRLVSYKGHLDSFNALKSVRREFPETEIWVLGDGDFEPELKSWVKENDYEDHIKFLGYRRDIIEVIQCFDIQLFPSYMEGTPNTLYEALAVGNVIVASRSDGQKEILKDEEDALLFECGEIEEIAARIKRLIKDKELELKLIENAKTKIKNFDGKKTILFLQDYYKSIINETRIDNKQKTIVNSQASGRSNHFPLVVQKD